MSIMEMGSLYELSPYILSMLVWMVANIHHLAFIPH